MFSGAASRRGECEADGAGKVGQKRSRGRSAYSVGFAFAILAFRLDDCASTTGSEVTEIIVFPIFITD